jgi:ribosomal-protein-alanine N-acetyltransferase
VSCEVAPLPAGAAEPLAAMHRGCFPDDPWDAAALHRILALTGAFGYLGWQGGAPVGFILVRDLGDEVEILSLGVLPAARRQGIGRALLAALLVEAGRRRVGSVVLEVAAGNGAARRLYAACGFTQVGRRPRYYRSGGDVEDALILRRSINCGASPI